LKRINKKELDLKKNNLFIGFLLIFVLFFDTNSTEILMAHFLVIITLGFFLLKNLNKTENART